MRRSFCLRVLPWATLAALAFVVPAASHAQERESRLERQMATSAARQARESERAQVARERWESERRRSAAHARMADTMYASTPSAPVVELSCPVVTSDDVRRAVLGWGDEVSTPPFSSADRLAAWDGGVFRAPPLQGVLGSSWLSGDAASAESAPHDAWSSALATASNADTTSHLVPLFPAASDAALQGFVRVINHSGDSGEVEIEAIDDMGRSYGPLTLLIDATETVHFNSDDLESGNAGKGLTGSTGAGEGDWRLVLTSDLDVEVLSYIRTTDGFLTAMHDLAPEAEGEHRIAIFNPGSNAAQVSRLRLINPGEAEAQVAIEGVDDRGASPGSALEVTVAAGASQMLTAAELESGGTGMTGALGDGTGKWQLTARSESSIHALSLLSSPTGHLTNLSTAPSNLVDGVHEVALFPSASDISGRQGFVRVINRSESTAEITIRAHDETDWEYEPLSLSLDSGQVAHFNSNDLEQGNAGKGLTGSTGAGEGDWRLALSSDVDIEVLSYIRTTDGFLTAMHDVAPVSGTRHRVAIFNPGSNTAQVSRLRLVNAGEEAAQVTIDGTDDQGLSPGSVVFVTVPAGGTRTYTAQELESGAEGLEGALGDGAGKWRLELTSDVPIRVLSLLSSPTGHLTNLSTAPQRGAGPVATAEEVFRTLISGPILQTKCINCHVEGGVSGNTRLVLVTDADTDHMATNLSVFEDFLAEVEDGADLILNKVQGVSHGGGIQLASGTEEFSSMERFLGLLEGAEVAPVTITPANLFDGVKMESWRSTLRRAAIIFAGRIPTDEEYASVNTGGPANLRPAIRSLMEGPEFHEFLIRASNDRLLTDRDEEIIGAAASDDFVDFSNLYYDRTSGGVPSGQVSYWYDTVQYGIRRAPLELIAYVAENDLSYADVLTADYIMANPMAAEAYGAQTEFDDPGDVHEFKPSEIASYYRDGPSKVSDYSLQLGTRVTNPGDLSTEYPHAGILNTTVFLLRYPTTPTNRNRARSRWTYYHFLGLDIEKSAPRTTDPVALADTNNPTMHNPACVVCHTVLDPLAGAFQNYGNDGFYRDQWGGLDSLDGQYKEGLQTRQTALINARDWENKETVEVRAWLPRGHSTIALATRSFHNIHVDYLTIYGPNGAKVAHMELEDSTDDECGSTWTGNTYELVHCPLVISVEIPQDGEYELETAAYVGHDYDQEPGKAGTLAIWAPYDHVYQEGETWYRDMRNPGFERALAPDAGNSLQWLAQRIVADERFAEATVKFWWPAIMGRDVLEPPTDEQDVTFEGRLLASNAQAAEVASLASGFRRGFHGGSPLNLKDLLAQIVLSGWFRTERLSDDDPVRWTALQEAGAKRLLTPEELARKTAALTGFQWGRGREIWSWKGPQAAGYSALTDDAKYRLLYGGIDSGAISERARDKNSVMAAVAKSHAVESSCPIVMKEFFLLSAERRRLFSGIDITTTPAFEFGDAFAVEASSSAEKEALSLSGRLRAGSANVRLTFTNFIFDEETELYRKVRVDRLDVRNAGGEVVFSKELEELDPVGEHNAPWGDFYWLHVAGSLDVPIVVPVDGNYDVDVIAWADQAGDEPARLEVLVESDTQNSRGAVEIRKKLVELHNKLLGVQVDDTSAEIETSYRLFVEVWERQRDAENSGHTLCDVGSDLGFLDGILDDAVVRVDQDWGWYYGWDFDRVNEFMDGIDDQDPHGIAATWQVVLAFLMMDYHYLYL